MRMYFPNYIVNFAGVDKSFTVSRATYHQLSIPLLFACQSLSGEDLYFKGRDGGFEIEIYRLEQFPGEDLPEEFVDMDGNRYYRQHPYYIKMTHNES